MKTNFIQIKNVILAVLFSVILCTTAKAGDDPKNVVKLNLFSLAAKSISLQYERAFTPQISACMGINYIANRGLPSFFTNADPSGILKGLTMSGLAITPEFRWYPFNSDKDAPKGFYLAPYFRYLSFGMKSIVNFHDSTSNVDYTYPVKIKFTGYGAGLMIGKQWLINDKVSIDWWIIGGHYGASNLSVSVTADVSNIDQSDLKKQLDDVKLPIGTTVATVNNNGATLKVSGLPFAGLRTGLTIGFAF